MDALKRIVSVRAHLTINHAFFANLLLRLQLEASQSCQAMATDGTHLRFNPDWVIEQPDPHLVFVCAHEAMHCAMGHHARMGNKDLKRWNEACDYAINHILVDAKVGTPPPGILLRDDLAGLSAEKIYQILTNEEKANNEQPDSEDSPQDSGGEQPEDGGDESQGQGEDNDDSSNPSDGGQDESSTEGGDAGDAGSDSDGDSQDDNGQDGGGESGDAGPGDGEGQTPSYGGCGAIEAPPTPLSEAEAQAEVMEWQTAMVQASNFAEASQPGSMEGELSRLIESVKEPRQHWRSVLRAYMSEYAKADYSWLCPNRRFVGGGMYLPSLKSEQLPPIAFVVDASASMPDDALAQAASEIQAIADELQPEYIDVYTHDTRTRSVERFEPGEDMRLDVNAGGGTRIAPTCRDLCDTLDPYAVVIWFTDLEVGDWDAAPEPDSNVIWLCWDSNPLDLYLERVAFGEVITMEDQ